MPDPDAPKSIFGEAVDGAVQVALAAINGRRGFHYQAVFLDDTGKPTRSAEKVLADLRDFCRGNRSTFDVDPRIHALLEGRREVFLRILQLLSIDSEQARAFVEVKDE